MSEPKQNEPARKIGAGHAEAMARLGLKELRNAVDPAGNDQGISDSEYGLYGTETPGEIARGREGGNAYGDHEQESPAVEDRGDHWFGREGQAERQEEQDVIADILNESSVSPPEADREMDQGR